MAKFSILMLAAPMAFAAVASPAAAEEEEGRSVVVRYDDLNLSSAQGRDRLNSRVKDAIMTVCGSRPQYRQTLGERALSRKCEDTATRDADAKLAGLFNGSAGRLADSGNGRIVVAAP